MHRCSSSISARQGFRYLYVNEWDKVFANDFFDLTPKNYARHSCITSQWRFDNIYFTVQQCLFYLDFLRFIFPCFSMMTLLILFVF